MKPYRMAIYLSLYRHDPNEKDHVAGQQEEDWDFVDPLDVEAHLGRRHERASRREGRSDALRVMSRVVTAGLERIKFNFS